MNKDVFTKNVNKNNNNRKKSRESRVETTAECLTKPRGSRDKPESNIPKGMLNLAVNNIRIINKKY